MDGQNKDFKEITPKLPLWSYQLQRDSKLAVKTRKDLEVHLITRAFKDEGFRQELLANSKAVVEKELGTKLLEEFKINILEETETTLYMVLPSNPYEGLSEPELQASLGITYEDVAQWVLEQQRNALLDEASSVGVIARAWKDEAFKQELLCSPKAVIEEEWGTAIPADIEIRVFEETAHTLYIVLPRLEDDLGYMHNLPDPGWLDANNRENQMLVAGSPGGGGGLNTNFLCPSPPPPPNTITDPICMSPPPPPPGTQNPSVCQTQLNPICIPF